MKTIKRLGYGLTLSLLVYMLLGFLVLPHAGRFALDALLQSYVRAPAHLDSIEFNPFTFELTIVGFRVGAPGAEVLGFQRLYVDVQVDSLYRRALHLREVILDSASAELLMAKDGQLNLSALLQWPVAEKPGRSEPAPKELFPLRVDHLLLTQAALHWQDGRQTKPVDIKINPLTLEVKSLSTLPGEMASLIFKADAAKAGHIDLTGTVSVSERRASGKLQLKNSRLTAVWPYVQAQLPLTLSKGNANLAFSFVLEANDKLQVQLDSGRVVLGAFALVDADKAPWLSLATLTLESIRLNLREQRISIGTIALDGAVGSVVREADGRLNWQRLLASTEASARPDSGRRSAWTVSLPHIRADNTRLHWRDEAMTPVQDLDIGPLQLSVKDFASTHATPVRYTLDTGVGEQGRLTVEGRAQLDTLSANLQLTTRDLDLRLAQAYLSPFVRLEVRSGLLDSQLSVDLTNTDPLTFSVSGNVDVNQLHTVDTGKDQDLLKWQQLQLKDIQYRHGETLSIAAVLLKAPYVRFIINENLTSNVSELMIPASKAVADEPSAPARGAAKPLAIHIAGVDISDGSANFADYSLTPNFATAIAQLNGKIGTLDNQQSLPAALDIKGKVDRYAPVSISGSLTPFDPLQKLDITAKFKRVELTTLTPYSGKFAGYRIRKGRLNLDLHYQIHQGQLKAQNKVVLEALQLGEKVDSPDAVDLPVRLAVALLKDGKGNIKIELPIEGDLNNPKFRVGPVIWKTLRHLLVRAVKSPFSFIGGLVNGATSENLDTIAFAPGSSELSAESVAKLKKLAVALKDRPQLRLEVEGASMRHTDALAIEKRLRQLARDRAAAIKAWLVDEGAVSDERIYLLNTQLLNAQPLNTPPSEMGQETAVISRLYLDSQ